MPVLNAASPLPLYRQLADRLLARIRSGEYPPGSRIPSEPELARRYGVGRPTVRQATERLCRRGRLERRRGAGTFVLEPRDRAVDLFSLAGTLASFRKRGIPLRSVLVKRPRRVPVADDPENPFAGRTAYHFSRLGRVEGRPILLEDFFLDPELFPELERVSLAGRSLSQLVDEHFHMRPESADQNFRIETPDDRRAGLLELARGEPVLLVKRTLHFPGARDGLFAELRCRTDRLVFSQTLGGLSHG